MSAGTNKGTMSFDSATLSSIAIVTPCFEASNYLKDCITSILDHHYLRLQYVIMDRGSTARTVEIIRNYADKPHYLTSGPDGGPYQAVASGFAETDAEILGWLNADDIYLPWTLETVGRIFRDCPNVDWISTDT